MIKNPQHLPATGFTLTELMVAVAIVAVLVAVATPSLRDLLANERASSTANDLLAALQQARSEAVRYSRPAELCPLDPDPGKPPTCGNDWSQGWIVRVDRDGVGGPDSETARVRGDLPAGIAVSSDMAESPPKMIYGALGQADAQSRFTITHDAPPVTRHVCVAASGLTRVPPKGSNCS